MLAPKIGLTAAIIARHLVHGVKLARVIGVVTRLQLPGHNKESAMWPRSTPRMSPANPCRLRFIPAQLSVNAVSAYECRARKESGRPL